MYPRSVTAIKFLHYYFTAANSRGHGIHSPFVFSFINKILRDNTRYTAYERVAVIRKRMLQDQREIMVRDYGVGSGLNNSTSRKISSIASHALKPPKYANLLFRLVKHFQPAGVLELGTSLGVTTSLMAMAAPAANIITMEGAPEISAIAESNFRALNIHNVQQIAGNFDETLPELLKTFPAVDFVFLDGNHRYAPTMQYFHSILPLTNEYSIIVMDDIHWSKEMERAWDECRHHPAISLSIDLFFVGILFFRSESLVKQHFVIRL